MQKELNYFQQQVQKLKLIKKAHHLTNDLILGYIIKNTQRINEQNIKTINLIIESLVDCFANQIINQLNGIQFVVVFAYQISEHKIKMQDMFSFFQNCVNQLSMNNNYLRNKFSLIQNPKNLPSQNKVPKAPSPKKDIVSQNKFKNFLKNQQQRMNGLNQRSKSNLAECAICLVQITHQDLSILTCGHILHKECIHQYLKGNILSKQFPLKCPFQECQKPIQTQDVEQYLPKDLLDKFYEFTLHNYVDKNTKNMSWCPTAGCTSAFEFDEHTKIYRCPNCKKSYCMSCKSQSHPSLSCQEYRETLKLSQTDKKFMQYVRGTKYKQCPKCKFWIEKSQGCCHMTCRCQYQFCYCCGKQYGTCNCQNEVPNYYGSDGQDDHQDNQSDQYMDHHMHPVDRVDRINNLNGDWEASKIFADHSDSSEEKIEIQDLHMQQEKLEGLFDLSQLQKNLNSQKEKQEKQKDNNIQRSYSNPR